MCCALVEHFAFLHSNPILISNLVLMYYSCTVELEGMGMNALRWSYLQSTITKKFQSPDSCYSSMSKINIIIEL